MKMNEFSQKNFMRLENSSAEMQMRETNLHQAKTDHRNRLLLSVITLAVMIVILFFLFRPLFAVPVTERQKQDWFYEYTTEKMVQFKPQYYLYEELSDPAALLEQTGWELRTSEAENQQDAADKLLVGGGLVRSWDDLVQDECARMWEEWYYGTEDITANDYILREKNRQIDDRTIPGLGENTWLVYDGRGDKYILIHADGVWAARLLGDFE